MSRAAGASDRRRRRRGLQGAGAGAAVPQGRRRRAADPDRGRGRVRHRRCRSRRSARTRSTPSSSASPTRRRWATSSCRARPTWWWSRPATADLMAKAANGLADDLAVHHPAGHRQAGADGAGDERADVAARRHPAQPGAAEGRRRRASSGPTRAPMACGEFGPGRMAEPRGDLRRGDGDAGRAPPAAAGRQARADHRRPHRRADRSGAGDHQPLQRQAGLRHRRRPGGARGAG